MPASSVGQLGREALVQLAAGGERGARGVVHLRGRAEHAQRRVALELVDPAAVALGALHHELEEGVQQRHDLRGRPARREPGGAHHVHEEHGHLAQLPAEAQVALERGARHIPAHVAAEQVAQALPLREARGHAVEARLEHAHLARVVHGHARLEVAGLHPAHRVPDRPHRIRDRARGDHVRQKAHDEAGHGEEEGGHDRRASR